MAEKVEAALPPTSSEEYANTPSHYVGIGASAGGLEAIESFFKHMPLDSGASFVVIQHLSPDHKSLMPELLAKRTDLKVHRAEDGMVVEKNNIYLITPRKNLRIFHGKLLLSEQDRDHGLNLPIDIFFKALAEDQSDKSIGIVLSGTGSDGTRGIRAIKESGGMVMAQNEESAKFDSMPRSVIATGLADFILPPEEMPQQLAAFIRHPYTCKSEISKTLLSDEDGLSRIFSMLRDRTKVDFTYYKPSTVLRRIERRMTINQVQEVDAYVRYLEAHMGELDILYKELLIGVTNFFRDPEAFEVLGGQYIPELLNNVENREVRAWVTACSTGEEAYTLAILFREAMEQMGKVVDVKIFATDLDQTAVERASIGRYPESIVADIPNTLLKKYFIRHEECFQVIRGIREMVVFAQHNLVKDPPFTNIDLLTCRNLLIYLQPVLQRKALELFNFSLTPQGVMLLGTSESIGEMSEYFNPLNHKWKLYRSRGKRKPNNLDLEEGGIDRSRLMRGRLAGSQAAVRLLHEEERVLNRFIQAFADDYVLCAMVLNDRMEIIHTLGNTNTFLRVSPGMMTTDASRLVCKELSIPLSTGVQKVLKNCETIRFSKVRVAKESGAILVQMVIKPLAQKKGQDPLVGIFINEMRSQGTDDSAREGVNFDVSKEAEQRIADLEQELQFTRENLQATVEELETSNEELQATNEELLASNEELQSTNEELQSVNEELYTVNAEYQSKITELTQLNNDMDNLLGSTQIGTLFLDENLCVRRFSPKITDLLNVIEGDMGRPIGHLSHNVEGLDIENIAKEILKTLQVAEHEFRALNGNWYLLRAIPYSISSTTYSGVMLVFIDITQLKTAQHALQESEKRNALAQRAANIGTWEWDINSGQLYWSDLIEPIFGFERGAFSATYEAFIELIHPEDRGAVEKATQTAIEKKQIYTVDHRIIWPDESIHWLSEYGMIEYDENNAPMRMVGTVQDITKRKQAEEMYQSLTGFLQELIDAIPYPLFYKNPEGIYVGCNKAFEYFAGKKRGDILGKDAYGMWPKPIADEYTKIDQQSFSSTDQNPQKHKGIVPHADGTDHKVLFNQANFYNDDGSLGGLVGIIVDINDCSTECPPCLFGPGTAK